MRVWAAHERLRSGRAALNAFLSDRARRKGFERDCFALFMGPRRKIVAFTGPYSEIVRGSMDDDGGMVGLSLSLRLAPGSALLDKCLRGPCLALFSEQPRDPARRKRPKTQKKSFTVVWHRTFQPAVSFFPLAREKEGKRGKNLTRGCKKNPMAGLKSASP